MSGHVTFLAKYSGKCGAGCFNGIEPGDVVCFVDDVLMHVDCEDGQEEEPLVAVEPCTTCWLIHPAGACDA